MSRDSAHVLLADQETFTLKGTCYSCGCRYKVQLQHDMGMCECPGCGKGIVIPRSDIVRMYELAKQRGPVLHPTVEVGSSIRIYCEGRPL